MKQKDTSKRKKIIYGLSVTVIILTTILIYVLCAGIYAALISFSGMIILLLCMINISRCDQKYINEIAENLTELMDSIMTLEEKDVFAENEDTIVSKLQSKVIKLIRIMKKKNEETEEEKKEIQSLVSDIAHQLKTPSSNLKMYSDFLKDDNLTDDKRSEYISILGTSIDRLIFLTEKIIRMSRLESGIISVKKQTQSLNETVLIAVKNIYPTARINNIEIKYEEEQSITISHDRNWISEAVFNLLENAVKYSSPKSGIYLSIKKYGQFSAIEVTDQNPPIPEDERPKIFTRFYRGSNSTGKDGLGIGLALVREIAIKHCGYVKLSCSDTGNTFKLVINNEDTNRF